MIITINPEIQSLIPCLSTDEYAGLTISLMNCGQFDLIKTGYIGVLNDNTVHFIIDGHNRKKILEDAGRIPEYDPCSLEFEDLDAAKLWVIGFQLGRRNLKPIDRIALAEKQRVIIVSKQGKRNDLTSIRNQTEVKPSDKASEIAGVSHDTYSKGKQLLEEAPEEVLEQLRQGKTSINKAYEELKDIQKDPIMDKIKRISKDSMWLIDNEEEITNDQRASLEEALNNLIYIVNNKEEVV